MNLNRGAVDQNLNTDEREEMDSNQWCPSDQDMTLLDSGQIIAPANTPQKKSILNQLCDRRAMLTIKTLHAMVIIKITFHTTTLTIKTLIIIKVLEISNQVKKKR